MATKDDTRAIEFLNKQFLSAGISEDDEGKIIVRCITTDRVIAIKRPEEELLRPPKAHPGPLASSSSPRILPYSAKSSSSSATPARQPLKLVVINRNGQLIRAAKQITTPGTQSKPISVPSTGPIGTMVNKFSMGHQKAQLPFIAKPTSSQRPTKTWPAEVNAAPALVSQQATHNSGSIRIGKSVTLSKPIPIAASFSQDVELPVVKIIKPKATSFSTTEKSIPMTPKDSGEVVSETTGPPPPNAESKATSKKSAVWSRAETSKLLQLYAENINNIGPMKSFRTKKMLFEYIATELNEEYHGEKSGDQANMKYKNVISVKKQQVSEKRRSGASGGRKIDFEDELAMIASLDDSIEPEILMGVDQIVRKQSEAGPKKPDQKPRRRKMDINETLDNFMEKFLEEKDKRAKEREEAKERRHQEKLSKIDQLLSLLKNQSEV